MDTVLVEMYEDDFGLQTSYEVVGKVGRYEDCRYAEIPTAVWEEYELVRARLGQLELQMDNLYFDKKDREENNG